VDPQSIDIYIVISITLTPDKPGLLASLVIPGGEASNSSDQSPLRGFLFFQIPHSDKSGLGFSKIKNPQLTLRD